MRLDEPTCRDRLSRSDVAYLATTGADATPHIVPVTFALADDELVIGVDQKPKTTTDLRRLRNIRANPRVAVLCDHYSADWSRLWWVRLDGTARVVEVGTAAGPGVESGAERHVRVAALAAKYPQYATDPPAGPMIVVRVDRWSGWSASEVS